MTATVDYAEFTRRNIGFVSEAEQSAIRNGAVFVCGVGGMGGACVTALVRAGVSTIAVADFDRFETSNLNRQLFATTETLGKSKVEVVSRGLRQINPALRIDTFGREWTERLDAILPTYPVVVNAMDDLASGVQLYRKAREHRATVIDAYTAPLPSVTVVRPGDPRPEERLRFPTVGKPWTAIGDADRAGALFREIEYVMTHSSSRQYIDPAIAAEVFAGKRSRMSFAPMVITAGCMMAFEALNLLIGRRSGTDHRGYFFNPWAARVERPRPAPAAWLMGFAVRAALRDMARAR